MNPVGHPRALARLIGCLSVAAVLSLPTTAVGHVQFGAWGPAVAEAGVNTAFGEGCPIESPNGRQLFIASNRTGTLGGNDIWVAGRSSPRSPWGPMTNLGAPINSGASEYCPTPLHGNRLLFVSERPGDDTCGAGPGLGDIYLAHLIPGLGWQEPIHLGCDADGSGPNFPGAEYGPSLVVTAEGTFLFFSSTGYGADMDIYMSRQRPDGSFAPATPVTELNTTAGDFMPNVSANGLEIVFMSTRSGGYGGQDIYTAHRDSTSAPWSNVQNVGPNVNTAGNESRPSLSGDGLRLHFGRDGDIYISTRLRGGDTD